MSVTARGENLVHQLELDGSVAAADAPLVVEEKLPLADDGSRGGGTEKVASVDFALAMAAVGENRSHHDVPPLRREQVSALVWRPG